MNAAATTAVGRAAVAGTRPAYRRDIEGLRAVAVLLVVLYHAGVPVIRGGFVGVDVFFVISGFVITSLLIREHQATGRISPLQFYARRARRILPAATLVVGVTIVSAHHWLGPVSGNTVASDARWTAAFAANIHFALEGVSYAGSQAAPSPLQHTWSLGVEEQFYLVWPALLFAAILVARGRVIGRYVAVGLGLVAVLSFGWCVWQTGSNATWAYFSPFTRAWELALGGLVAALRPTLARIGDGVRDAGSVLGLTGIAVSAVVLTSATVYPGAAAALPAGSAAVLIACGVHRPNTAGRALSVTVLRWIGARSYSLYLWHWPLLTIAATYAGHDLPLLDNLGWAALALVAAALTYGVLENPIRRSGWLGARPVLSLALAVVLVRATFAVAEWGESAPPPGVDRAVTRASAAPRDVLAAVARAQTLAVLPSIVSTALATPDPAEPRHPFDCRAVANPTHAQAFGNCDYGDPAASRLLVVYGDSRANMWAGALEPVARRYGWRLEVFSLAGCPAAQLHFLSYTTRAPNIDCDSFHATATAAIRRRHPAVVLVTSISNQQLADRRWPTPQQWRDGLVTTIGAVTNGQTKVGVLGDIPVWRNDDNACLTAHPDDVQRCSSARADAAPKNIGAERAAATATRSRYVDPAPWVCAARCEPVIAGRRVYSNQYHFTQSYTVYLQGALGAALRPLIDGPR